MFKRAVDVRGQQRLSGADRKKLRRAMRETFRHAQDPDLDQVLPPKGDVMVSKMANKALVYALEGGPPMLFDVSGRGDDLFPTVFALWKAPSLLPSFLLKGAEVSHYVLSGADLMLPGVQGAEVSHYVLSGADLMLPGVQVPPGGFPEFKAGEVWSVKVPFNDCPIAVGTTLIASGAANSEGKGKLLRITHFYRDWLWESAEGSYVPNAGFLEDIVRENPSPPPPATDDAAAASAKGAAQGAGAGAGEGAAGEGEGERGWGQQGAGEGGPEIERGEAIDLQGLSLDGTPGVAASGIPRDDAAKGEGQGQGKGGGEGGEGGEAAVGDGPTGATPAEPPLSVEEMDSLLEECLKHALCTTVKPSDLPLAASTLWSHHILPCRPPGVTLDVKKSSHKKLSKWLQAKTTQGLISGKEDKHRKEYILSAINYKHPQMLSFEPLRRPTAASATSEASSEGGGGGGDAGEGRGGGGGGGGGGEGVLEVEEVWKPSSHVAHILNAIGADASRYYTASEARQLALDYVQQEKLVKPGDASCIVLDAYLCDALFKGAIKKGSAYPTQIHFKDLGPQFLSRMQAHHRVTRGSKTAVRKGALASVQIVSERRQGNKKVTRATGLEGFLVDAELLAVELQKRFACSTSVSEVPGKKGCSEVLVQGGVIDDLGKLLVERYGIPRKHIEVLDKTRR